MRLLLIVMFQIPIIILGQKNAEFRPDETISGIRFNDSISALKRCPNLNKLPYSQTDTDGPFANYKFYNKDSTEILTLVIYPGSYKNCFYVFNVCKANLQHEKGIIYSLPDRVFVTESGIKIGMIKSELIGIKGRSDSQSIVNGLEILGFKINYNNNSAEIFKRYSMPEYYANYSFKQDRLVEFEFGFTYP
jgi:hypothetical protein